MANKRKGLAIEQKVVILLRYNDHQEKMEAVTSIHHP